MGDKKGSLDDLFSHYSLSPQQIAVITGLLLDTLIVQAVLVDNDQRVEIVLEGDLSKLGKKPNIIDDLRNMKIGEVFK